MTTLLFHPNKHNQPKKKRTFCTFFHCQTHVTRPKATQPMSSRFKRCPKLPVATAKPRSAGRRERTSAQRGGWGWSGFWGLSKMCKRLGLVVSSCSWINSVFGKSQTFLLFSNVAWDKKMWSSMGFWMKKCPLTAPARRPVIQTWWRHLSARPPTNSSPERWSLETPSSETSGSSTPNSLQTQKKNKSLMFTSKKEVFPSFFHT